MELLRPALQGDLCYGAQKQKSTKKVTKKLQKKRKKSKNKKRFYVFAFNTLSLYRLYLTNFTTHFFQILHKIYNIFIIQYNLYCKNVDNL